MTRLSITRALAIFFGAGLLRPAPGTWGSAVAVAMGLHRAHDKARQLLAQDLRGEITP